MDRVRFEEDKPQTGAPGYMVTYGDMMGQLLCFFIILVSMSTVRDEKFRKLMDSIREAFGFEMGVESTPGDTPHASSLWDNVRMVHTPRGHKDVQGGSEVINLAGREFLCRTVREGRMVTVGETAGFAPGDAQVPASLEGDLAAFAAFVREYPNRLLVRGHVAAQEVAGETDAWDLSYRRARAVGDCLERQGVNPKRLRLSACGAADPADSNLTDEGRARNRRVEIIVSEELVQDVIPRRPDHD